MKTKFFISKWLIGSCLILLIFGGCGKPQNKDLGEQQTRNAKESSTSHAVGFSIEKEGEFKLLHFFTFYEETPDTITYLLYPKGTDIPSKYDQLPAISTPVESMVVLSTTHLAMLDQLDALGVIKGISSIDYVWNEKIHQRYERNELRLVGETDVLNIEAVLELNPQLVMASAFPNLKNKHFQQLESLGTPVLLNAEWKENTLLGRAEWVKVLAALVDKSSLADSIFDETERKYQEIQSLTSGVTHRPVVITGAPYQGAWYVPGGRSHQAQLLKDAGATYPWASDSSTGGIQLDFEVIYEVGLNADIWLNPGSASKQKDVEEMDARFLDFKAVQNRQLYNSNKREKLGRGNDYYESGTVNPHLILADITKIIHPELLPNHEWMYFQPLD